VGFYPYVERSGKEQKKEQSMKKTKLCKKGGAQDL